MTRGRWAIYRSAVWRCVEDFCGSRWRSPSSAAAEMPQRGDPLLEQRRGDLLGRHRLADRESHAMPHASEEPARHVAAEHALPEPVEPHGHDHDRIGGDDALDAPFEGTHVAVERELPFRKKADDLAVSELFRDTRESGLEYFGILLGPGDG